MAAGADAGGWQVTFTPEFAERFWARVVKTEGCWLWTGCKRGQVRYRMKQWSVGQVAWTLTHEAPLPPGLAVFHACGDLLCVKPAHLTTERPAQTHCHRGHELKDPNLYHFRDGTRTCRTCTRERQREWSRLHPRERRSA
jgi:hypothetical protein